VPREHVGNRGARGFDHHGQAQGVVHQPRAVMDRLPRQPAAQHPAIAFDHPDPAGHVVQQLVARPEQ